MWLIIVFLVVGFTLGRFDLLPFNLEQITDPLVFGGLFLLIFSMGLQVGANPEVISKLDQLGLKAIMLAAGAIAGSLAFISVFDYYGRR